MIGSMALHDDPRRPQSRSEEWVNSAIHAVALLACALGLPLLVTGALRRGEPAYVVGASIFGATTVLLYLASTIYHALPPGRAKRLFRVIDHSAIYLLIAGTYTPFTLGVLRGGWGWTLLGIVWALAVFGILAKSFGGLRRRSVSVALYLGMGWLVAIAAEPLLRLVPLSGVLWLLAGGLAYTAGVVFYATDGRLRYGHSIWHLFVGAGTACHFVAVVGYAG
jgi:hemolysin III